MTVEAYQILDVSSSGVSLMSALNSNLVSVMSGLSIQHSRTTQLVQPQVDAEPTGVTGGTDVSYSGDAPMSALNSNLV